MEYIDDVEIEDYNFEKGHIPSVHIQYNCAAVDSKEGTLCFVDDITPEFRKHHKFYCLSCGKEMVANLKDEYHKRHFKHKNKTECNSETYLHNLAKKMLADRFMKSEHFYVSYDIKDICLKHDNCKYQSEYCNNQKHERQVDLKRFYQHCEIEKSLTGKDGKRYIADICLLSNDPKIPPMLIEIFVSHACTDEKKHSGLWIMEIPICSETDIVEYCNTDTYTEGDSAGIELFNIPKEKPAELVNKQILRFIHIPDNGSEIRYISCKEAKEPILQNSDLELNILREPNGFFLYKDRDLIDAIEFELHIDSCKNIYISDCEECINNSSFEGSIDEDNQRYNIDFFKNKQEGLCSGFDKKESVTKYCYEIINQIQIEFVKGSKPKEYHLFVIGPQKFYNTHLIEEYCKTKISELINQNLVLCAQERTGGCNFTASVYGFAEDNNIPFRMFVVDWNKYGNSAGYKSNKEVVDIADELIVFNNPIDKLTQDIIQKARNMNKPITLVDLAQVTRNNNVCPKCGGILVRRQGRYGQFFGCSNYPECDYIS